MPYQLYHAPLLSHSTKKMFDLGTVGFEVKVATLEETATLSSTFQPEEKTRHLVAVLEVCVVTLSTIKSS